MEQLVTQNEFKKLICLKYPPFAYYNIGPVVTAYLHKTVFGSESCAYVSINYGDIYISYHKVKVHYETKDPYFRIGKLRIHTKDFIRLDDSWRS